MQKSWKMVVFFFVGERQHDESFWGYRVVRSYSNDNPLYHKDGSIEWYEERDHNTHPDYPDENAPVAYYRICSLAKGHEKKSAQYLSTSNVVTVRGKEISGAISVKYVPPPNDGCEPCNEGGEEDTCATCEEEAPQVLSGMNAKGPKFLFIHHSCGENWLRDGLRDLLKKEGVSSWSCHLWRWRRW